MKVTQSDLLFWHAVKGLPKWAKHLKMNGQEANDPRRFIDSCINGHVNKPNRDETHHAGNMINFLKSTIKRKENLLQRLDDLASNPGTIIRPERRAGYARKWAKRLRKNRAIAS